jgi:thiosulfate sulfurtransferase
MSEFKHISCEQVSADLDKLVIVDIRDEQSFQAAHSEGAFHLTNASIQNFMQEVEFEQPIVVVCYHGVSSQGAAQYMLGQGFEEVYSMDGGFEAWRKSYPYAS